VAASYPYTPVTAKLKTLLQKVRSTGTPQKLTAAHLKTLGFSSSNDASMIGVFKFIGFVDGSGVPTPLWSEYRGQAPRKVLGRAIRQGYAELFSLYPNAQSISVADLTSVFATSSTGGEQVISKTVTTFKTLVDEADFDDVVGETSLPASTLHAPATGAAMAPTLPPQLAPGAGPEVHIDIQIHISPESSADQIEKIFESMAKHLYGKRSSGDS
jgi:hypothetical protein